MTSRADDGDRRDRAGGSHRVANGRSTDRSAAAAARSRSRRPTPSGVESRSASPPAAPRRRPRRRSIAPVVTTRTETFTVTFGAPLPTGGTLNLNASARDAAGNTGTATGVTVQVRDVVAPTVASVQPANSAATGVSPAASVTVTFSEPMNRAALTTSSVRLTAGATAVPVALAVSADDRSVTLTPATAACRQHAPHCHRRQYRERPRRQRPRGRIHFDIPNVVAGQHRATRREYRSTGQRDRRRDDGSRLGDVHRAHRSGNSHNHIVPCVDEWRSGGRDLHVPERQPHRALLAHGRLAVRGCCRHRTDRRHPRSCRQRARDLDWSSRHVAADVHVPDGELRDHQSRGHRSRSRRRPSH